MADTEGMIIIGSTSGFSLPSAYSSATAGLASANQSLEEDAQQIATSTGNGADPADVAGALVGANQSLLLAEAAAKIVKTADQMLGTLFDSHA